MSAPIKDIGLDAGRSANPLPGMEYTAIDTSKFYRCYVEGTWVLENPARIVSLTSVGNVGAGEDDLISVSLPVTLNADNKGIRIVAWGNVNAAANTKIVKLHFGSQVVLTFTLAASVATSWRIEAYVFRISAGNQKYTSTLIAVGAGTDDVTDAESGLAFQNDAVALTIKATGEATTTNDIIQEGMLVEPLI